MMVFQASFVHIVQAKLGQADAGDNEAKVMTKLAPEWDRTGDPVIRSPARYRWTTAPALDEHRTNDTYIRCVDKHSDYDIMYYYVDVTFHGIQVPREYFIINIRLVPLGHIGM